ncbi:alpha/beta hydrolase [Pseudoalteromonas piratica]|uniref:Alpha/beta hydrolase n=1 Tax=Pseudoalteromonas piratica TaxID=1348114 RepID=A0A0A7EEZ0_9GAMM|nr:alpha/beta hydrolase [Pseudoalteromonas piratica]AIY65184.1 hypothetical protein OM33_08450 [Pseudoalteromonas piratica]
MNMKRVFKVHGFNVEDGGAATIDNTSQYILQAGFAPIDFDYGHLGLVGVVLFNHNLGQALKSQLKPGDCVVAHSNGAAIAVRAAELGAQIDTLILINPALKSDYVFPKNIRKIVVYWTKHDKPVKISRAVRWLTIGMCKWGAMGATGYTGRKDDRVTNFDMSNIIFGHSEALQPEQLKLWFGKSLVSKLRSDA